jgi:O-antigen ligase
MLLINSIISILSFGYVLIFSRSYYALAFISFSSYWFMVLTDRLPLNSMIAEIIFLAVNLLLFFAWKRKRFDKIAFIYFLFSIYIILNNFLNNSNQELLILSVLSFSPLLFYVLPKKKPNVNKMAFLLVLCGLYLRTYLSIVYDVDFFLARYDSSLWAINSVGAIFLLFMPFITDWRVYILVVFSILISFSRGLIFIWVVQEILLILMRKRNRNQIVSFVIMVSSVTLLIINTQFLFEFFKKRFFNTSSVGIENAISTVMLDERSILRELAYEAWQTSQIFGLGIGGFSNYIQQIGYHSNYSNAHNLFLTLLVELGVFGLAIFIFILISMLVKSKNIQFTIAILSWLFYGLYSAELYSTGLYYSFFIMYFLFYIYEVSRYKPISGFQHGK